MGPTAGRGTYVTDLVLGLLDSLELGRVRHHAEALAFVLLELLLVAHLEDRAGEGLASRQGRQREPQPAVTSETTTSQEGDPDQKAPCSDTHRPPQHQNSKHEPEPKSKCSTTNNNPWRRMQRILSAKGFT